MTNQISATIVAHSINSKSINIYTFLLVYPRLIHAELLTHRVFSRNAASSRAIPIKKLIQAVRDGMFVPKHIQKEHTGMQGTEYFEGEQLLQAQQLWIDAAEDALKHAERMRAFGMTKQLVNRVLEPYQYFTTLVTTTELENYFSLRSPQYWAYLGKENELSFKSKKEALAYYRKFEHSLSGVDAVEIWDDLQWLKHNKGQAEIHLMELTEKMYDAVQESKPKILKQREWHIPFRDKFDEDELAFLIQEDPNSRGLFEEPFITMNMVKIATSMAARTSYTIVGAEKEITYAKQIELHDKLINQKPLHASPMEHCAEAQAEGDKFYYNLRGFKSYRYLLEQNPELLWR